MAVYRETLEFLAQQAGVRVLNVFARKLAIKRTDVDVFDRSWEYFIQRTHNFAQSGGTIGDADDHCLLITDRTQDDRLRYLMRRMRAYNYVPSSLPGESPRKILATRVLDDPVPRVSLHSYLVQLADLVGYALARRDFPRNTLKRYAFEGFFDLLSPVLLKEASKRDPQGIVYWPRQDAVK